MKGSNPMNQATLQFFGQTVAGAIFNSPPGEPLTIQMSNELGRKPSENFMTKVGPRVGGTLKW
jgi:hypothetical protein